MSIFRKRFRGTEHSKASKVTVTWAFDNPITYIYPLATFLDKPSLDLPWSTAVPGTLNVDVQESIVLSSLSITYEIKVWGRLSSGEEMEGSYAFPFEFTEKSSAPGCQHVGSPAEDYEFDTYRQQLIEARDEQNNLVFQIKMPVNSHCHFPYPLPPNCFMVCASESPVGDLPTNLQINVQDYIEFLGMYMVTISAPTCIIAGVIDFSFSFPHPPTNLDLIWVKATVTQKCEISIAKTTKSKRPFQMQTSKEVTFLHWKEGKHLKQDQPSLMKLSSRLPDCEALTFSSSAGSLGPINTSHSLNVILAFTLPNGTSKAIQIKRPIKLAACSLIPDNMSLPPFTEEAPPLQKLVDFQPERPTDPFACACGYTEKMFREKMTLKPQNIIQEAPLRDKVNRLGDVA